MAKLSRLDSASRRPILDAYDLDQLFGQAIPERPHNLGCLYRASLSGQAAIQTIDFEYVLARISYLTDVCQGNNQIYPSFQ